MKACKVIAACVMLHNSARQLKLDVSSDSKNDSDSDSSKNYSDSEAVEQEPAARRMTERGQVAAGKETCKQLINNFLKFCRYV